uniref:DevC protein n=2 Tax=Gloeothece TaxID=28070 RepID=E0U570_GLOV7|nr:DevC protein [Gloeothece verrucosa PCC 7822]
MIILKLPLAWLQLKHEKIRLLVAIAGISFAVVLIFMQLGFQAALFDSAVHLHNSLRGDIFLLSTRSTSLIGMKSFSERRLYQALALPEVEFVTPIYLGFAQFQNPFNPSYWRNIHVIGFEIQYPIFKPIEIQKNLTQLKQQDVVLFDRASRFEYGAIADGFEEGKILTTEIDNIVASTRKIRIGGLFQLGTSFGIDGNLLTSHVNFLRIFSQRNKGLIDVGLIQLESGIEVNRVQAAIRKKLPPDVRVFTKQEWIEFEKNYWMSSTAIGFIFTLGVGMGLIVGIVVVYQILYTDVSDHLKEYATLNAMGYKDRYFLSVVLQESIILAILGYIPGFLISSGVYNLARKMTLLPIAMTQNRSWFVFSLTLVMCFLAGMIAMGKLRDADPSDIF